MNTKTAVHITDNYLLNPTNPVTVNLIGAGGTGSHMITELAILNHALTALGHAGLQVNLFDDDIVSEANLARQLFADAELGLSKSVALINRTNRFFGTNWKAVKQKYSYSSLYKMPNKGRANIYISCVDTSAARFDIAKALNDIAADNNIHRDKALYWMDLGNSKFTGQVILSTITAIKQPVSKLYETVSVLTKITDEFKELLEAEDDKNEPSCSLAEALERQSLFINQAVANPAANLLTTLFREGMTDTRGVFINLKTFTNVPLKIAC